MFIMALHWQGQRPAQINQMSLNPGSALQKAHTIIYLIIWRCVRLLCKQNGMQIAFVCFFFYPSQSFSAWFKALTSCNVTHTRAQKYTRRIMFTGTRELDKPQMNVLPPPPGLIFPRLSRGMCAQINQSPCSNQSHLYHLTYTWHCWGWWSIGDKVKVSLFPAHRVKMEALWTKPFFLFCVQPEVIPLANEQ